MGIPLRVLIIEDSENDALLSVRELRRGGYEVIFERVETARAMAEALEARPWDLILADYTLPHFSGEEALQLVKEKGLDLPFIVVSGTIGEDTAVATLKMGAHDYLLKGKLKRLVPAVERELREAEARRERRRLEEQLRQAQKMEGVGHLAGGLAHDFNNILSAIMGYADLTLAGMKANDPLRRNVERILESARKASTLTHGLLAFSRKQPLNPMVADLNEILKKFEDFFRRLLREDIEFHMTCTDRELPVRVDPAQIEQAMMNLVTNAADAMPAGGSLTIETRLTTLDEDFIRSRGYGRQGDFALLSVRDTGVGMDEKTKAKIFEPFFTTKEVGKGTGLGLSMVYGIVRQHEGFIAVSSKPEEGSTFLIYLPIAGNAVPEEVQKRARQQVEGGPETVLIAEDDDILRELLHDVLQAAGYRVIVTMDGEDAVRRFTENSDVVHLFISDIIMPRKNGAEAYEEIKAIRPDIKVIFISGYTRDILLRQDIPAHEAPLISKPFSPETLLRKVRELLDARSREAELATEH